MTGIDVSYAQSGIAPGAWDFIIAQLTHDTTGHDVMADQHFPNALKRSARRGGYHYANPASSSGAVQGRLFATRALELGFRKNVDIWALDSEEHMEPGAKPANAAWVREWFATVRPILGELRWWYVGWPYYLEHFGGDLTLLKEQPWWLPAYGPNDGHPYPPECPFLPLVHQYSSRGGPGGSGLDVNRVLDTALWSRIFSSPTPAPAPAPPKVKPVIHTTSPLVDVKQFHHGVLGHQIAVALTRDGGIFAPAPGVGFSPFTPVGQAYWKGEVAAALAVAGDPDHPLTAAEAKAKCAYVVISESNHRYAFGQGKG